MFYMYLHVYRFLHYIPDMQPEPVPLLQVLIYLQPYNLLVPLPDGIRRLSLYPFHIMFLESTDIILSIYFKDSSCRWATVFIAIYLHSDFCKIKQYTQSISSPCWDHHSFVPSFLILQIEVLINIYLLISGINTTIVFPLFLALLASWIAAHKAAPEEMPVESTAEDAAQQPQS